MQQERAANLQLLRYERERRGWTQADVADAIGASEKMVSRWERGTHMPYPAHRKQLCELYGRTLDELFPRKFGVVEEQWTMPPFPGGQKALVGRQELLEVLVEQLYPGKYIALTGLPGVGKTALVTALVHHPRTRSLFSDGVLWADLGPRPAVLEKLSDWAGHPALPAPAIPTESSLEASARALRKAIGMRHMLLVVNDAWELEAVQAFAVGGPNCAFLVTTRLAHIAHGIARRDCLYTVTVPELNAEDGLTLLERWSPDVVAHDKQAAQTLVQEVGGLPLALTLLGRALDKEAHSGQPRRLREALVRLRDPIQRLRVSEPQPPVGRSYSLPPDRPLSLQSMIAVSEVLLGEEARRALRALSVFPSKPNSFSEEAALQVSQVSAQALDILCDASLLESSGPERYTLHPTIADYARSHLIETMPSERLVAYYVAFLEGHASDYALLEREFHNLLASLHYAFKNGQHVLFVRAVNTFFPFLLARGFYDLASLHLQRAYEVALWSAGAQAQILLRLNLGRVRYQRGEYKKAREALGEVLNLARERAYHEQTCHLLILLGMVAIRQGEYQEAELHLREGLMLARAGKYHDAPIEAFLQEARELLPASFHPIFEAGSDES